MLPFKIPTANEVAAAIPLERLADLVADRLVDQVEVPLDDLADSLTTNFSEVIAESVAEHLDYEQIPIHYGEFDIDYDELAKEVDHSDIASELAYSHIGANEVAEELAGSIDESDVAEHICLDSLANAMDSGDICYALSPEQLKEIAAEISCAELAKHVQDPWSMMVTPFQETQEA
jgi:hypothetical protein